MLKTITPVIVTGLACLLVLAGISVQVYYLSLGEWRVIGILAYYIIILGLFIIRKPSLSASHRFNHWFFALGGVFLPFTLHPTNPHIPSVRITGDVIELIGMGITLVALLNLGKSFGIIASKREIKTHGLYQKVRHPLYAGEALWFLGIVLQHASVYNGVLFVLQIACQLQRIEEEEQILSDDSVYQNYQKKVKYKLLPGVY